MKGTTTMSTTQLNWEDCKAKSRRRNNNTGKYIKKIDDAIKKEQQIKERLNSKPTSYQICMIINLLNELGDTQYIKNVKINNVADARRIISNLKRLVEEKGIVNEQRAV